MIVEVQNNVLQDTKNARLRHIVERNPDGSYKDKALCGFEWDMLHIKPNGTLCEECEEELQRRRKP